MTTRVENLASHTPPVAQSEPPSPRLTVRVWVERWSCPRGARHVAKEREREREGHGDVDAAMTAFRRSPVAEAIGGEPTASEDDEGSNFTLASLSTNQEPICSQERRLSGGGSSPSNI